MIKSYPWLPWLSLIIMIMIMLFHLLAFVFAATIVYFTASTAFASGFMTMIIVHVLLIMMFTSLSWWWLCETRPLWNLVFTTRAVFIPITNLKDKITVITLLWLVMIVIFTQTLTMNHRHHHHHHSTTTCSRVRQGPSTPQRPSHSPVPGSSHL